MSPTSCQTAPSRDIIKTWRRKRDSNPCAACTTSRFSRPVPSTRLGYSSIVVYFRRQIDYTIAFFSLSTDFFAILFKKTQLLINWVIIKIGAWGRTWTGTRVDSRRILSPVRLPIPPLRHKMVTCMRFELMTLWLKVKCSTNWANRSNFRWLPRLDSN